MIRYIVAMTHGRAIIARIPAHDRKDAELICAALERLGKRCFVALQVPAIRGFAYIRPETLDLLDKPAIHMVASDE